MIKVIDIHDLDYMLAIKYVRDEIKIIGKNVLVIIHGYGSSGANSSYKKLTEVRNIGKSRMKKKELSISISGPDLVSAENRVYFTQEELVQLNKYVVNSGVTIMKK